jgi:hypothetical protein
MAPTLTTTDLVDGHGADATVTLALNGAGGTDLLQGKQALRAPGQA